MDPRILVEAIAQATGETVSPRALVPAGGGCINEAWEARGARGAYFVKINRADRLSMFEAEQAALAALAETRTVRVPVVHGRGIIDAQAYIVMEGLPLNQKGCSATLGRQLAALHRIEQARFGFGLPGFIGSTPQPNDWSDDWVAFYRRHRLGYQLDLARERGLAASVLSAGERLLERLPVFFSDYDPMPSLLHGDLWGGNHAFLDDGTPVLFDPASYHGDREADLAMTELFGGYDMDFYDAYRESWPLDSGYKTRRDLYNLYHVLNHYNLFGGSYGSQAGRMIERLLAESRA